MKNKKFLYVLIPAVIIVWGMIIYKIVAGISGDEPIALKASERMELHPAPVLNDTFSIHPDYRDPFSGKEIKKNTKPSANPVIRKPAPPVVKANWPQITYGGIVKNQKSNKQLVLVTVNGQSTMVKAGESFANVELLKVFKDSIEVAFGKERRFIKK